MYKLGTKIVKFPVSDDDLETLKRRRKAAGSRSLAEYCHDYLLDGKLNRKPKTDNKPKP